MNARRPYWVLAFAACALLGALMWWVAPTAHPDDAPTPPRARVVDASDELAATATAREHATPDERDAGAFAPPRATVRDRALRDDLRRRILAAWVASLPTVDGAVDAGAVTYPPMPQLDGGRVDPEYLRARIREDFVPMARVCYEQLLTRSPGAAGRAVADFVIVGDERVGGVVDTVAVDAGDGGLAEEGFATCLRESMSAMAFAPPPERGSLRVRYPFVFAPDDAGR